MSGKAPTLDKDAVDASGKVEIELTNDAVLEDDARDRDTIMESIMVNRNTELEDEIALDVPPVVEIVEVEESEIAVKINGEERTISESDIKEYQKGVAADEKFKEVAREKKALEQREAAFAQREAAFIAEREKAAATPVSEPVPVVDDDDLDATAESLITSVFAEDKEGVKRILKKTLARPPAPVAEPQVITPADIDAVMDQRERSKTLKDAVMRFNEEYPELSKGFSEDVDRQTIVEMQSDPEATPWDIIKRSAEHVKEKMATALKVTAGAEEAPAKIAPVVTPVRSTVTRRFKAPVVKKGSDRSPFEEIQDARGQG